MANGEKAGGLFSSLKYTNILLTIITLILISSVLCKHLYMSKKHLCWKSGKGAMSGMMGGKGAMECPVSGTEMPAAK